MQMFVNIYISIGLCNGFKLIKEKLYAFSLNSRSFRRFHEVKFFNKISHKAKLDFYFIESENGIM